MLPVTLTFAGVAALLNIWLGWRVGQVRIREKMLTGDGGNHSLVCRMRAHANYAEYTPFVLILIAALELAGRWPFALWAVGAIYFLGRIAHAFGMDQPYPAKARQTGTGITLLTLLGLAIWALVTSYAPAARMTGAL
jgi:uncharacterized membrane protein YecN with MAPEG domain